jgi:hypothetical protein
MTTSDNWLELGSLHCFFLQETTRKMVELMLTLDCMTYVMSINEVVIAVHRDFLYRILQGDLWLFETDNLNNINVMKYDR